MQERHVVTISKKTLPFHRLQLMRLETMFSSFFFFFSSLSWFSHFSKTEVQSLERNYDRQVQLVPYDTEPVYIILFNLCKKTCALSIKINSHGMWVMGFYSQETDKKVISQKLSITSLCHQPWHYAHFESDNSLLLGTVLCFVGCSAASLASTH